MKLSASVYVRRRRQTCPKRYDILCFCTSLYIYIYMCVCVGTKNTYKKTHTHFFMCIPQTVCIFVYPYTLRVFNPDTHTHSFVYTRYDFECSGCVYVHPYHISLIVSLVVVFKKSKKRSLGMSIHVYIHYTCIYTTYIYTYIHAYIHTYIHRTYTYINIHKHT